MTDANDSFSEIDDFLPISALQHLNFCERQVALIHVLGRWEENVHTAMGRALHERVDSGETSSRSNVQVLRNVALRCERLKLVGFADVVEVQHNKGCMTFLPVEYKKGRRTTGEANQIQLGAQAMALEEMTGTTILEGAIFLAGRKRRLAVAIDEVLRQRVTNSARRLHELVSQRLVPRAVFDARCSDCSLRADCGPDIRLSMGGLAERTREVLA